MNQRWWTGRVARRSLGTEILVPGIVQNECTFNPFPLFPGISLQIPSALSVPHTKNATLCHSQIQTDHSEVMHLNIKPLTLCPEAVQYCPRCYSIWGFSCGQAHVCALCYLLSLRPFTLPGLGPLTVTVYCLINQTLRQGDACQHLIATQIQFSDDKSHKSSLFKSSTSISKYKEWIQNRNKSKQHHSSLLKQHRSIIGKIKLPADWPMSEPLWALLSARQQEQQLKIPAALSAAMGVLRGKTKPFPTLIITVVMRQSHNSGVHDVTL